LIKSFGAPGYRRRARCVQKAVTSLKGEAVTANIQTSFHLLTKDNIEGDGALYIYKSSR
jgi:ribose transport system substrate-binding protein